MTAGCLPPQAFAASLAALPGMGPARLLALLRAAAPADAWAALADGLIELGPGPAPDAGVGGAGVDDVEGAVGPDGPGTAPAGAPGSRSGRPAARAGAWRWPAIARATDVGQQWRGLRRAGIAVTYLGAADYPSRLRADPQPPAVVFWRGDLAVVELDAVAVIGTRRATGYGRSTAHRLGRDLADAGLCVVSGLALGIDGAAHDGALAAGAGATAGVAASGVDVPYPRRHVDLWERVTARGVVLSEAAPGQPAQPWRFPARNRIIAGLVQAVVVVESHAHGGSLLTVDAAAERGVDVLAVPGPVTSAASEGSNQLLRDGRPPVRHARDVLDELGRFCSWPGGSPPGRAPSGAVRLDAGSRAVLDAIDWTPTAASVVAERTGVPIGALGAALVRLEDGGLIRGGGGWWERCAAASRGVGPEDERMV